MNYYCADSSGKKSETFLYSEENRPDRHVIKDTAGGQGYSARVYDTKLYSYTANTYRQILTGTGDTFFQRTDSDFALKVRNIFVLLRDNLVRTIHPVRIREYFVYYPGLMPYVQKACQMAIERFQTEAQLTLELVVDPEYSHETLVLYVRQQDYSPDFYDQLDEFRTPIYRELQGQPGTFTITTDFQDPI